MPMPRPAEPGAFKLPQGARDREKFNLLEAKVIGLERQLQALVAVVDALKASAAAPAPDKEALIARAVELGVGPASTLARWGVEKLTSAIAEKEAKQ